MRSEYESSISVHNKTETSSDHNNPQSSCNDDPMYDYIITKVYIDRKTH